jgi:hypothetical protein
MSDFNNIFPFLENEGPCQEDQWAVKSVLGGYVPKQFDKPTRQSGD